MAAHVRESIENSFSVNFGVEKLDFRRYLEHLTTNKILKNNRTSTKYYVLQCETGVFIFLLGTTHSSKKERNTETFGRVESMRKAWQGATF